MKKYADDNMMANTTKRQQNHRDDTINQGIKEPVLCGN